MIDHQTLPYLPLGIIIPGVWSVETGLLIAVAGSLIARSISDIWMIQNATVIESCIIGMNKPQFQTALLKYLAALPMVILFIPVPLSSNNPFLVLVDLRGEQCAEVESGRAQIALPNEHEPLPLQPILEGIHVLQDVQPG